MANKDVGVPWKQWIILGLVGFFFLKIVGENIITISLVLIMFVIYGALLLSKNDKKNEKEWDAEIELQRRNNKNG